MKKPLPRFWLVVLIGLAASCSDRPTEPGVQSSAVDPSYATTSTSADALGPRPHAILRRQFDQLITESTDSSTAIAWDVEDTDFGDLHTTGASEVTLGAGTWLLIAVVNFQADPDGYRGVSIGSSPLGQTGTVSSIQSGGSAQTVTVTLVTSVPAGTTKNYWVLVSHTAGNSISVLGARLSYFMVVQLGSEPYVRLRKSAHQGTVSHTTTAVTWDVELEDAWNLHAAGAPTVTLGSGMWLLSPMVGWGSNANGFREARLAENGTEIGRVLSSRQGGGTWQSTNVPLVTVIPAGVTRNYEVRGFQTSGANLSVLGETCFLNFCLRYSHFNLAQLSPAPHVVLRKVNAQTIPSTTSPSLMTWDEEVADSGGLHNQGSDVVTLGPGTWLLIALVNWEPSAHGIREVIINEGGLNLGRASSSTQDDGSPQTVTLPLLREIGQTENYEVRVIQTDWAGDLDVLGHYFGVPYKSHFIAVQVATR